MVTYQRAFDYMNEIFEYDFTDDEIDKVAQCKIDLDLMCMKAIKKQIPEKPIAKPYMYGEEFFCPSCNKFICFTHNKHPKYCDECGQALDWSK